MQRLSTPYPYNIDSQPVDVIHNRDGRPSAEHSSALSRLLPVEGLRAYLALWVLIAHVLWVSGYQPAVEPLLRLIGAGGYAVQLFMILSGFVIALLLDKQEETYLQFVVRRFFRLFPVFIVLFAVAIPLSQVSLWNVTHSPYLTPELIESDQDSGLAKVESWWENIHWNIPLHLLMLHGVIPDMLVKDAPSAFLVPAWTVSLEWQFYLVAPLAFAWVISAKPYRRFGLCALCAVLFLAGRYVIPTVEYGAALPFRVEFFFLGAASYFFYKGRAAHQVFDTVFPVACCLAAFLFWLSGLTRSLIPVVLWMAFFGLLLEQPTSLSSRVVAPLFTNPLVLYLGRISYSLYLSHVLVIIVIQAALLKWAPSLSHIVHFWALLVCTMATAVAVSTVLYRYIEAPGIRAGRALVRRFAARRSIDEQQATASPEAAKESPVMSWG